MAAGTLIRDRRNTLALSFVSGFVDALFFIQLGGLFVGLVTGNVVLLGLGIAGHSDGGLRGLQILSFPLFMAGAAVAALISIGIRPMRRATRFVLFTVSAAFAVAAMLRVWTFSDAPSALTSVLAMGMLTSINRMDAGLGPPFSLMTGNIAGLATAFTRRMVGYSEQPHERARSLTSVLLVAGFVAGCSSGAFAQTFVGIEGMLIPSAVLALIALLLPAE